MNTPQSVAYGWYAFMGAGAIAYFLAKRSIAQDRLARADDDRERLKEQMELRRQEKEMMARRRVEQGVGGKKVDGGKYEAKEVFRSKKGDRLS